MVIGQALVSMNSRLVAKGDSSPGPRAMSKKSYQKAIGDPLKKFRQPPARQECPPQLRKHLEQMMEEDHRSGKPLRAAVITASNGVPDKWFFEKARALGYKFEDEFKFWTAQRALLWINK